jgi:hypothetical protein
MVMLTTFKEVEIPDLLSFDSWEFSATTEGFSSASTTKEECSLVTTSSFDTSLDSATTYTTTSQTQSSITTPTIQVSVSGVIFSVEPSIFERLEKLPWKWSGDNKVAHGRVVNATSGANVNPSFDLHTSPVLFEMLLNFLMFGSLPVCSEMSSSDCEELELLTAIVGLNGLHKHLEKKNHAPFRRASGSFLHTQCRRTHQKDAAQEVTRNKRNKKTGPVRSIQAALTNRRLTSQQPLCKLKYTHAELCASSHWIE